MRQDSAGRIEVCDFTSASARRGCGLLPNSARFRRANPQPEERPAIHGPGSSRAVSGHPPQTTPPMHAPSDSSKSRSADRAPKRGEIIASSHSSSQPAGQHGPSPRRGACADVAGSPPASSRINRRANSPNHNQAFRRRFCPGPSVNARRRDISRTRPSVDSSPEAILTAATASGRIRPGKPRARGGGIRRLGANSPIAGS